MRKLLILFLFASLVGYGQTGHYEFKIAGTINLPSGIGTNKLVFVPDTTTGGMLFRSTQAIAFNTTVRAAIASGKLVISSASSLSTPDPSKVSYKSATGNIYVGNHNLRGVNSIYFRQTPDTLTLSRQLFWNDADKTLSFNVDTANGVTLDIGHEMYIRGVNKTLSTINDGQVVYVRYTQGNRPKLWLAQADSFATSNIIGVATQNIANNLEGNVTVFGVVHGFNTSGFAAGDILYLSATTPGALTNALPASPNFSVPVAIALNSTNNGSILVEPKFPIGMDSSFADLSATSKTHSMSEYAVRSYVESKTDAVISSIMGTGVDTSAFDTSTKFLAGYSDGVVIDTIIYIMYRRAGSPNVTPKLHYGTDMTQDGTEVISSPSAVTSYTTPTKVSSIDNATIPVGNMVWLTFTGVSVKPKEFFVIIKAHRQ